VSLACCKVFNIHLIRSSWSCVHPDGNLYCAAIQEQHKSLLNINSTSVSFLNTLREYIEKPF